VSPDGRYLYVRAYDGDVVMAISTETGGVVRHAEVDLTSELVEGIGVHPGGQSVYVVEDDHTVAVVRTSDFEIEAHVAGFGEPFGLAVTPDGRYVCAACCHDNELTVLRTSDNTICARVSVGRHPLGAVATPDGRSVYVACEDSMCAVGTDDFAVDTAFPIPAGAWRVTVQPGGEYVYVVHETGLVSVVRVADNRVYVLGPYPVTSGDIACVPGDAYAVLGLDGRRYQALLLGTKE